MTIHHELIIAGFGGQGVLKMGQTLAEAAMNEGRHVVWTPAYGAEMRGGPSYCTVVVSSEPIGSPVVATADTVIVMDLASLPKYQTLARPDGRLLVNSSLVDVAKVQTPARCYPIPANHLAEEVGEGRIGNMVMLGAFLRLTGLVQPESVIAALAGTISQRHRHLLPLNEKALQAGAEAVERLLNQS